MAATSGRHAMVLVYLNVRTLNIAYSVAGCLMQHVFQEVQSSYRHCAHGSHRQQWLELCTNAQHRAKDKNIHRGTGTH